MVGAELRRTFVAQRGGKHVSARKVVADTSEEGDELGVVLIAAHANLALLLSILARTEVVGAKAVVGEILVVGVEARIARILV